MSISNDEIYRNALEHARQLSTLRFAILTVFMTATGALLSAYFVPPGTAQVFPQHAVSVAGIWLSVVFLGCEIALSYTMHCQNGVAEEKLGNTQKHRSPIALWSIRVLISSVYVGAAGYWASLLF